MDQAADTDAFANPMAFGDGGGGGYGGGGDGNDMEAEAHAIADEVVDTTSAADTSVGDVGDVGGVGAGVGAEAHDVASVNYAVAEAALRARTFSEEERSSIVCWIAQTYPPFPRSAHHLTS